jgi:hypothetical protein
LADFWGIEQVIPEMFDDKGTSLILVNSEKGRAAFDKIMVETVCQQVDLNEAIKFNSAAITSVKPSTKRKYFFDNLDSIPIDRLIRKCVTPTLFSQGKRLLRKVLRILRHRDRSL